MEVLSAFMEDSLTVLDRDRLESCRWTITSLWALAIPKCVHITTILSMGAHKEINTKDISNTETSVVDRIPSR